MNSKNEMKGRLVKSGGSVRGKQGLDYHVGISADTVGAKAIHMQTVIIAPGSRAHAHKHTTHETAIYALSGTSGVYHGEKLEHHTFVAPGDYFYIPADVPHLPYNPSETETVVAVIARTDPNEQESVVLMPELEKLVPQFKSPPTAPAEDQKELFETAAP
ncbi:MAG: cupin domain-containing protein [Pseudomonadota bacterium]